MSLKRFRFLTALAVCVAAAQAQTEQRFTLSFSPFHLALPVVEIMGEYALSPKFAVAAIGGFGSISVENSQNKLVTMPVLELGAQANYYVVGSFRHGMQLGAELLWLKIDPPTDQGVLVDVNGMALGPFVGYKWAARFGLTFMVQGGYEFLFAQADAKDEFGREAESSAESGVVLFNSNVGWSF